MTHLLLFTAFVLWYACFEAKDDAQEIAEHREIDHVAQWLTRAAVFGSVWYLLWVLCGKPSTWPVLIGHAFLFSAVFRWRLNKRRGKHWAYVAPWSNLYDRVWTGIGFILSPLIIVHAIRKRRVVKTVIYLFSKEHAQALGHYYIHYGESEDTFPIHRAGTTAYLTEITLFALGTAGAVVMQLKG